MSNQQAQPDRDLPECPNVLLSIEPEHAEAILDGEKTYEYRRVVPARDPPYRLVLYASAPVQAAVGVAWSHTVESGQPETVVEDTVTHTPHEPEEVHDYFAGVDEGHALRVDSYRRFDDLVPRCELVDAGMAPAQNFRYLGSVIAHPRAVEPARIVPGDSPDAVSVGGSP